jgi:hypothetical protein
MEEVRLNLSEHEIDIVLHALEIALDNSDEYEDGEYEDVIYKIQKELDEDYDDELE